MNKQRKVVITVTYNEMGIIIDTKAEEVAQQNLQPTCNELATDCISRQAAIDEIRKCRFVVDAIEKIRGLPSAQPEIVRCKDCKYSQGGGYPHCNRVIWWNTREDDFCSRAERREKCVGR